MRLKNIAFVLFCATLVIPVSFLRDVLLYPKNKKNILEQYGNMYRNAEKCLGILIKGKRDSVAKIERKRIDIFG